MCVFARVQRACGGPALPPELLVYVYTTYLEEFAGVLACICLTALTDPDPDIQAASLRDIPLSHRGSPPSLPPVLRLHDGVNRVGCQDRTVVLCVPVSGRKTNSEFRDLPFKRNASAPRGQTRACNESFTVFVGVPSFNESGRYDGRANLLADRELANRRFCALRLADPSGIIGLSSVILDERTRSSIPLSRTI